MEAVETGGYTPASRGLLAALTQRNALAYFDNRMRRVPLEEMPIPEDAGVQEMGPLGAIPGRFAAFGGEGLDRSTSGRKSATPTRALLGDVLGEEPFDGDVPYGLVMELLVDSWLERGFVASTGTPMTPVSPAG